MLNPDPPADSSLEHEAIPPDEALPSLPVLLGADPRDVLAPAVSADGATVEAARRVLVLYRPGRRVAVRYWCEVRTRDGESFNTTLVAAESTHGVPEGAIPVETAGTTVAVWRWPNDPFLPGLRPADNPDYVRALLDAYGAPPGRIYLRTLAYLPGRRAVIEVTIPPSGLRFDAERGRIQQAPTTLVLFIKVVRPGEVDRLYQLHSALGPVLPVAACPGGSDEHGILVLEALRGRTLGDILPRESRNAPEPEELLELTRSLGRVELPGPPRVTMGERVQGHLQFLRAVLPSEVSALDRLAESYGEEQPQPLTTVHGDFHEQQVLVERGRVTGLLDVDDAGPGQRVDDLASMFGRLWALSHYASGDRSAIRRYAERLLEAFSQEVDPVELRRRAAGALIGRATMPFRSQAPSWPDQIRARLRLAQDWLDRQHAEGHLG